MKGKQFAIWGGGFLASTVFIWILSSLLLDSVVPVFWDSQLDRFVREPGVARTRSEGWADTKIGAHGIHAHRLEVLEKYISFIVWGDSYVDALQVDAVNRFDSVYNKLSAGNELQAVGIGGGGKSVADYFFMIPRYERLFPNVKGNVILLSGMDDILPGKHVACHSQFVEDPFRYIYSECEPSQLSLDYADFIRDARLEFAYSIFNSIRGYDFKLYNTQIKIEPDLHPAAQADVRSLTFALDKLREASSGFLAFVYCPLGPFLGGGSIDFVDKHELLKEKFKVLCEERGVLFVDLTEPFNELCGSEWKLPRGFFNTPPGAGHFNKEGHLLIAETMKKIFSERGL